MKKITENAVNALLIRTNFKSGNTVVTTITTTEEKQVMRLHGSSIAILNGDGSISVNNAGYETTTTKERLNGVLSHYGARIYQKNFVWYIEHQHGVCEMHGGWYNIEKNNFVLTEPAI